jgi:hypothetical protein
MAKINDNLMCPSSGDSYQEQENERRVRSEELSETTEPMFRSEVATPTTPQGKDECYATLAQVNLLRVRKQREQAIELCETAVRQWPIRGDAHALLGDLYQESGRIDDAILRYCRVLELEPDNKSNRNKMSNMVRFKRQALGPIVPEKKKYSLRSDRLVRAVILTLATIMLVTIMTAPLILQQRKERAIEAQSGTTVDRRINLNPIVLQPVAPQPVTGDEPATVPSGAPSMIRDPVEEALVDLMGEDPDLLQQGIQVLNAEEDPPDNGFSITFLDRPGSTDADSRDGILRSCMRVAMSANMRLGSRETRQLSIRCLLLSSPTASTDNGDNAPIEATTSLVFTGTILRSVIPGANFNIDIQSADQLSPYFTNIWWGTGEE